MKHEIIVTVRPVSHPQPERMINLFAEIIYRELQKNKKEKTS